MLIQGPYWRPCPTAPPYIGKAAAGPTTVQHMQRQRSQYDCSTSHSCMRVCSLADSQAGDSSRDDAVALEIADILSGDSLYASSSLLCP